MFIKKSRLRQCRGYRDNGRGVSIGFNTERLRQIHEYFKLGKVNYVDVNSVSDRLFSMISSIHQSARNIRFIDWRKRGVTSTT